MAAQEGMGPPPPGLEGAHQAAQYQYYQFYGSQRMVFDGKRVRKRIARKFVDYSSSVVNHFTSAITDRDYRDYEALQPHDSFIKEMMSPLAYLHKPANCIATKFVHTSTNIARCPINVVTWTPEGRRLITGNSNGEFTLWNGSAFNFETIMQAHDSAVRTMIWSHNENWMITGDHDGVVKYWQPNMNFVKAFSAHKEAVRGLSFCPTDIKFASCSDDVTLKIWDFATQAQESVLTGHGWDVKDVSWHPHNSLIVSGSKDNLIKLWDSKSAQNIATIHAHKNTVVAVKWNKNGNWILSAGRDQMLKLFDIRTMREVQSFKGHKKEVTACAWHPFNEGSVVSGDFEGSILYWNVGLEEPVGEIKGAHESSVFDLAWHPLGHILCSGSNDHTTKFWCRNRPGDPMDDRYNMGTGTAETDEADEEMKQEKVEKKPQSKMKITVVPGLVGSVTDDSLAIPGLGVPSVTSPSPKPQSIYQPITSPNALRMSGGGMPVPANYTGPNPNRIPPPGMPPFGHMPPPPPGFNPNMPPPGFNPNAPPMHPGMPPNMAHNMPPHPM